MSTIAGMCFFKANGRSYDSQGEFTVTMGGKKLDPLMMASGAIHTTETNEPGMISGTIATMPGLSLQELRDMRGVTVQIQAKSGHVYALRNAFFSGQGEVNPTAGTMNIEFTGSPISVVS
jgi:hypothetical protein